MDEKNLWSTPLDYSMEYFWTTFGPLWSTPSESRFDDFSPVFIWSTQWSTFGLLLDNFEYPI